MNMLSFSKVSRIFAALICIASLTLASFSPVTDVYAAEGIPGTDAEDPVTTSEYSQNIASLFNLTHAKGSVKVTNSSLKKATPDIKIKIGNKKLSKKAFAVKARIDGEKTELIYIPVKTVVKRLGGSYKKSGSKVTVTLESGALSSKLSFKVGKDNYSIISTDQENDFSVAVRGLYFGKSCMVDNTVYVPIEAFAPLVDNGVWDGSMVWEQKKNSMRISSFPRLIPEQPVSGGWGSVSSPALTPELQELFNKAVKGYHGVSLTPVAYIAMQVVAGFNHRFICRKKPVIEPSLEPTETYAFVEIYEDLSGNAEITSVTDTGVETDINGLLGGWSQFDYESIDMSKFGMVDVLLDLLSDGKYRSAAILSTQIVSGVNICLLCTRNDKNGSTGYSIVYAYMKPDGTSAEITDSIDL